MDFGAHLRQARERRGISLRQIAIATKISTSALEALERNDVRRLPGGIFSRAFVRAYAVEVGLDPEETIRQFLAQFPIEGVADGSPYATDSKEQESFESQRQMAGALVRLILISLPIAAVILYFTMRGGGSESGATRSPGEQTVSEPTPSAPVGGSAGGGVAPEPAPPPVAPPVTAAPEAASAPLTITLLPEAPCWVSLQVDGQTVVSRLMQAGERESHQGRQEIVLNAGDAGALGFTLNGRPGRRLGNPGQVVTARITAENVLEYIR